MKALLDAALAHGRMVLLLLVMIFIAGAITYAHIPKESSPDVPVPYIYTAVMYEGISPEDAERLLTRPLEQALRSIEGIKRMTGKANAEPTQVHLPSEVILRNSTARPRPPA